MSSSNPPSLVLQVTLRLIACIFSLPQFQYAANRLADASAPGGATGAKETRTPNIQLAKLALYQLSYNPESYGPEWT